MLRARHDGPHAGGGTLHDWQPAFCRAYRPSTIAYRPSTTAYRPSTIAYRPSTIAYRPSTIARQALHGIRQNGLVGGNDQKKCNLVLYFTRFALPL